MKKHEEKQLARVLREYERAFLDPTFDYELSELPLDEKRRAKRSRKAAQKQRLQIENAQFAAIADALGADEAALKEAIATADEALDDLDDARKVIDSARAVINIAGRVLPIAGLPLPV